MTQVDAVELHDDVEVEVNYRKVRVPHHTTGRMIKERAGLDLLWSLFIVRGRDEIEIENDEAVVSRDGEHFVSTPCLEPS